MSGRGFHTKRLFSGAVLVFLFLFITAVLSTPFLVNSDYVKDRVSGSVASKTGIDVTCSDISLSFSPGFHIRFSGIRTGEDQNLTGSIGRILVYPDIFSLFKGDIKLTKVVFQDFEEGALFEEPEPENARKLKTISPLFIRNAAVRFKSFVPREKGIKIVLKNVDTRFFTMTRASAQVRFDNGRVTGKGRINHFQTKKDSFESFLPKGRPLFSAETDTADILFSVNENGDMSGKLESNHLAFHSAGDKGLSLNLKEPALTLDMSGRKSEVCLRAASLDPVLQKPEIFFVRNPDSSSTTLRFSAGQVKMEPAQTYANAFIGENGVTRNIFRIIESGVSPNIKVAFENENISGLFDPDNLIIKGALGSGTVHIPGTDLTAENVSGNAFMKEGTLDLEIDNGNINQSTIHHGTVSVQLLSGPTVPFTSRFSLTADLRQAPATLTRLVDNEPFAKELARMDVTTGTALVDLYLEKKREKNLTVEIDAENIRLKGEYDRMNDPLEVFDGSFSYKNKTARIDDLTAGSGGSYLYNTRMTFRFDPEPVVEVDAGKALVQTEDLFFYLVSADLFPAGSVPFSVTSGTVFLDAIELTLPFQKKEKNEYMMKGKALDIKTALGKKKKETCELSFDFSLSNDRISLSRVTGRVGTLRSVFQFFDSPVVKGIRTPFHLADCSLDIKPAEGGFTGQLTFPAGPAVELTVRRKGPDDFRLEHLSVDDQPATRFEFHNTGPKTSFEGFMSSSVLEKLFTRRFLSHADFFQITGNHHFLITSGKDSFVNLAADYLDISPLLNQKQEYKEVRQWLRDKPIRVLSEHLDAGRYRLDNVAALLEINPGQTKIRLSQANLCGIDINGTLVKKSDFLVYQTQAAAMAKDDLRHTAECLFTGETLMDGSYNFQGRFHSKSPMADFKETVSGNFEFSASKGRIYRLTLLSRILSAINVSRFLKGKLPDLLQDGFEYNTFSLKARVKNSRILVKEGIIDATDMSIIFTGEVDPVERKMDLTFLVAPFKTVDMIITYIPVLNTLLDGKLVSIPVKAEGSLKNPSVTPLHPSAVGKGLINMMKNIVNSPVKLMEKLP